MLRELKARLARTPVDNPDIDLNFAGVSRRKVVTAPAGSRRSSRNNPRHHRAHHAHAKRGGIAAALEGELGAILEWTAPKQNTLGQTVSGVSVSMVAGAGFEPAAFRLSE